MSSTVITHFLKACYSLSLPSLSSFLEAELCCTTHTLSFTPVFFKLFSSRPILHGQIFSRPLKKGLHLESISDSAIFPPKSRCSLKKKRVFASNYLVFRYFSSKIIVISKNPKFKISRPPLSLFATHQGIATPSLKNPGLHHAMASYHHLSGVRIIGVLLYY